MKFDIISSMLLLCITNYNSVNFNETSAFRYESFGFSSIDICGVAGKLCRYVRLHIFSAVLPDGTLLL
jgi:hypothetical protein